MKDNAKENEKELGTYGKVPGEESELSISSSLENPDIKALPFDSLLTDIGFGWYQWKYYIVLCLMALSEGTQISVVSVLIPILQRYWNVNVYLNSLQVSILFVAMLLGSVLSGIIGNFRGRKIPILIGAVCALGFAVGSAAVQEYYQLVVLRGFLGLSMGFVIPCAWSTLTEITPPLNRGRYMIIVQFIMQVGILWGYILSYLLLPNLSSGN